MRRPTSFTFIPRRGFATLTLAHMLDSLVRVSRRVYEDRIVRISSPHGGSRPCLQRGLSSCDASVRASAGPGGRSRRPCALARKPILTRAPDFCALRLALHPPACARTGSRSPWLLNQPPDTLPHTFPFSNFKHCLTLFSKSFSSFPRGTCSLSVSCQYLALDGIYHPL